MNNRPYSPSFYGVCVGLVALVVMGIYILRQREKRPLHHVFLAMTGAMVVWSGAALLQGVYAQDMDIALIWENLTYVGSAFIGVSLVFLGLAYGRADQGIPKKALLLLIVPVITQVMVWTNPYHHLFYQVYSPMGGNVPGLYFYVHAVYSYVCMITGWAMLCYFAIKNSGVQGIQAWLIVIGSVVPAVVNICYTLAAPGFNVYSTPLAFTFTLLCYLLAMFKFNLLRIAPVALQTVINRISDGFVVVTPQLDIIDYNQSFAGAFFQGKAISPRESLTQVLVGTQLSPEQIDLIKHQIDQAGKYNAIGTAEVDFEERGARRYYTVEFTPIFRQNRCDAVILLFKDITEHIMDLEKIQANQAVLLERERLASLGQLIGGIAHNLKTPIMAVSGGLDQLKYLAQEYDDSIEDPEVTPADHHEIAGEMVNWLGKLKGHMAYMSEIISAVKDQAAQLNVTSRSSFPVYEMLRRVRILMQHELVKNGVTLTESVNLSENTPIYGDLNAMVQILDNIIVNAVQAYAGKGGEIILQIDRIRDRILISVQDRGPGIDEKIGSRLFREMITTKGKNGTGLGLYMSYSTVKGMFQGDMWFTSQKGEGTTFYIELPSTIAAREGA